MKRIFVAAAMVSASLAIGSAAGADSRTAANCTASGSSDANYIVVFSKSANVVAKARTESNRGNSVSRTYSSAVKAFAATLDASDVKRLCSDPAVQSITPDIRVSISQYSWGTDRIDQSALPLNGSYSTSLTGAGVTAYVIDTGVYAAHSEFGGRVSTGYTAIADGNGSNDCNGHGTHVSGTIGGATIGVARSVSIVPVRVLDCTGSGSMSQVLAGINWMVADHQPGVPAVANLSLGGSYYAPLNAAIDGAVADGITVVVAAGNSNADACATSPASAASAITVAASGGTGSDPALYDQRASFSNYGSCVDVFAPGVRIVSSYYTSPNTYAYMSGTSMASPHVAGIAALYLQANGFTAPATVASAIVSGGAQGVISDPAGSPNVLATIVNIDPGSTTTTTTAPTTTTTSTTTTSTLPPTTTTTSTTTTSTTTTTTLPPTTTTTSTTSTTTTLPPATTTTTTTVPPSPTTPALTAVVDGVNVKVSASVGRTGDVALYSRIYRNGAQIGYFIGSTGTASDPSGALRTGQRTYSVSTVYLFAGTRSSSISFTAVAPPTPVVNTSAIRYSTSGLYFTASVPYTSYSPTVSTMLICEDSVASTSSALSGTLTMRGFILSKYNCRLAAVSAAGASQTGTFQLRVFNLWSRGDR